MSALDRAQHLIWESIPGFVGRRFPRLAIALRDGSYLTAWPPLAVGAPIAALLLGFQIGAFRPTVDATFANSIVWPMLLALPAAFGAALGIAAWIGFAIGDFFVFHHLFGAPDIVTHLWQERLPLLITYAVLAGLLVLLPLGAPSLADNALRPLRRLVGNPPRLLFRLPATAAIAAFLAGTWSASAQVLIRPIESFRGGFPSPALVQPLRNEGIYLMALVAVATGIRVFVEWRIGRTRPDASGFARTIAPPSPAADGSSSRRVLMILVTSALLTLLFAGVLDSGWQAGLLFGALLAAQLIRIYLLPIVPVYGRLVTGVPVLVRVVLLSVAGYAVGTIVFGQSTTNPPYLGDSWSPMVVATSIMILAAALIMPPGPATATPGPRR